MRARCSRGHSATLSSDPWWGRGLSPTACPNRARIAIYAPSDLVNGLTRMARAFDGGPADERLAVFRTRLAARTWLLGKDSSYEAATGSTVRGGARSRGALLECPPATCLGRA
jgi:hypothetical protein